MAPLIALRVFGEFQIRSRATIRVEDLERVEPAIAVDRGEGDPRRLW
jgi:hypothetical protein